MKIKGNNNPEPVRIAHGNDSRDLSSQSFLKYTYERQMSPLWDVSREETLIKRLRRGISQVAYGCVAHRQLCRATMLAVYRCDLVADRFIPRWYNGTEIHPRASRRVGIMALFLAAEKCNSVRIALCRCPSRIIGVFDTHVRDRMKKNRKGSRGWRTTPRDAWNLRHAAVKMIVVVNPLRCPFANSRYDLSSRS